MIGNSYSGYSARYFATFFLLFPLQARAAAWDIVT